MLAKASRQLKNIIFKSQQLLGLDEKIFVIGRNKTGTTSIKVCLQELGYRIGDQKTAELFIDDYAKGNFDNILAYCESAEVFQDAPFSWPNTYKHVYKKYPKAKYILLERDSSDEWFNSVVRFHSKIINNGNPVSAEDLKDFSYRRKGFLWQVAQVVYGVTESEIYNRDIYIKNYESYNEEVKEFFENKENFLFIKLTDSDAREKLAKFINRKPEEVRIPHVNRTK